MKGQQESRIRVKINEAGRRLRDLGVSGWMVAWIIAGGEEMTSRIEASCDGSGSYSPQGWSQQKGRGTAFDDR